MTGRWWQQIRVYRDLTTTASSQVPFLTLLCWLGDIGGQRNPKFQSKGGTSKKGTCIASVESVSEPQEHLGKIWNLEHRQNTVQITGKGWLIQEIGGKDLGEYTGQRGDHYSQRDPPKTEVSFETREIKVKTRPKQGRNFHKRRSDTELGIQRVE